MLLVIGRCKALRKAIRDLFGEVSVDRCQHHNERNVLAHLPTRLTKLLVLTRIRLDRPATDPLDFLPDRRVHARRRPRGVRRDRGVVHGRHPNQVQLGPGAQFQRPDERPRQRLAMTHPNLAIVV
jgi:hypothetical protein